MAYQNNYQKPVAQATQAMTPARLSELTTQIVKSVTEYVGEKSNKVWQAPNYSAASEINSFMMVLSEVKDRNGNKATEVCKPATIALAAKEMVNQCLSVGKKQCYLIVYGNQLTLMRSYFGDWAVFRRLFPELDLGFQVIHKGDTYRIVVDDVKGFKTIVDHETSLEADQAPIVGAYCFVFDKATGKRLYGVVFSKAKIDKSWAHSKTKNVQEAHPDDMALRTVIRNCIKMYINTADIPEEKKTMAESYNRTTENEYDNEREVINPAPQKKYNPTPDEFLKELQERAQQADDVQEAVEPNDSNFATPQQMDEADNAEAGLAQQDLEAEGIYDDDTNVPF